MERMNLVRGFPVFRSLQPSWKECLEKYQIMQKILFQKRDKLSSSRPPEVFGLCLLLLFLRLFRHCTEENAKRQKVYRPDISVADSSSKTALLNDDNCNCTQYVTVDRRTPLQQLWTRRHPSLHVVENGSGALYMYYACRACPSHPV